MNLDSLLIQLQGKVTPVWYKFGAALGIEKEILDRHLNYPPEQCIVEILDYWLRNHVERNWREVARALRQISYHQLANEVESIDETGIDNLVYVRMKVIIIVMVKFKPKCHHSVGKLLIEVNMDNVPDGVLHRSNDEFTDECPPPIPPKMFEGDLQNRDTFKYVIVHIISFKVTQSLC